MCLIAHIRPHTLQTTLTPLQEDVVVALRTTLLLPLDDLFTVTREFLSPRPYRGRGCIEV